MRCALKRRHDALPGDEFLHQLTVMRQRNNEDKAGYVRWAELVPVVCEFF